MKIFHEPKAPPLPSLETVELSGDPLEIAYRLGALRRKKILRRIEYWEGELARVYTGRSQVRKKMEDAFWSFSRKEAPAYLEEIDAMAEGAKIKLKELFCLNLTELNAFADKCTDLIFPISGPNGKRAILIAHNEDWNPRRNDVFLLKARLPGLEYVTLAYDGYLPGLSAGMNSHGLAHSVNYLHPRDKRPGLPRIFLARHLLTTKHIPEVLSFAGGITRAFGQSIHLAQGGRYLNLELSAGSVTQRKPRLPSAHTNHYLSKKMRRQEGSDSLSSEQRYKVAMKLLKEKWQPGGGLASNSRAREIAKQILSDRSGLPYAIWRELGPPLEPTATLATMLLCTAPLAWEIYRGPPGTTDPVFGKI